MNIDAACSRKHLRFRRCFCLCGRIDPPPITKLDKIDTKLDKFLDKGTAYCYHKGKGNQPISLRETLLIPVQSA